MSTFEDRLWSQLVREHGDQIRPDGVTAPGHRARRDRNPRRDRSARPRRSARRPALLTGTVLATAAVAAAATLALSATTSTPAFAVTHHGDGSITVTLNDIHAVAALNAELARQGIHARAVPVTAGCPVHAPMVYMPVGTNPKTYTIELVPHQIPAGLIGVVAATETPSGRIEMAMGAMRPPAPRCLSLKRTVFRSIDFAHLPPAIKARMLKARQAALAHARR